MISVVIPALNEKDNISELHDELVSVLGKFGQPFELIFIDDGSTDNSWQVIEQLSTKNPQVKGLRFRRHYGKSAALALGFEMASGDVVITMDADLQDSPSEIPELYQMITKENYDLVSGWKKKRHDPWSKTIPTKLFNWATRKMSGIQLHDFNCGLKAYKKDVIKNIDVYGEMHRYIPVLAAWAGFQKIGEKIVLHRERKKGVSKFGSERFLNGFLDLLSIGFVTKFGKRPMHLFGLIGTFIFLFGLIIASYLIYLKFGLGVVDITNRSLFFFGLLAMIIGTQLFLTGFISELIVRNSSDKNKYQIERKIGL